ncbi:hypothetical protein AGDE_02442 [Angomonas deanei]|uniref:Uncharacterized protein n=1 Tax=Angomonas deanei TaxID=59799 RepID=A0A7G2CAQ4_9TRYP|nr:hypothetical protein AGDE_02442 [Angomonas deanei]CAD2216535.1 hypothetical protein, conserved [Angomonas deanei]|eukprot:EPY41482.1 hypothetical protein AGDE_02442 [Angomonas deanei]
MLKDWFRGSSAKPEDAPTKTATRMEVDPEKSLETDESIREQRRLVFEKKLEESAKSGVRVHAMRVVTYDSIFQKAHNILLQGNQNETREGVYFNVGSNFQNTMVMSKWSLVNPKESNFEINLQMSGFSDVLAATWSTLSRYSLMYQRASSTGALVLAQFMAEKQQGMCQGMLFGMLQYPWVNGGCTRLQYVKDRQFSLSHLQRIIRGVNVGTNYSYDPMTHDSYLSYAMTWQTPKKDGFVGEICPSKGTWKVAATGHLWSHNLDSAVELEYKETREGMKSALNLGCRKRFIGGGELVASLLGFGTLKTNLTLPFGGSMPSVNQVRLSINCEYDVHSGAIKQGIVLDA